MVQIHKRLGVPSFHKKTWNIIKQMKKVNGIGCDSPVTIIVKRRPKSDRIVDFEEVMSGKRKMP